MALDDATASGTASLGRGARSLASSLPTERAPFGDLRASFMSLGSSSWPYQRATEPEGAEPRFPRAGSDSGRPMSRGRPATRAGP